MDYKIIDNFFTKKDLNKVLEIADVVKYSDTPPKNVFWVGERSESFHKNYKDFFNYVGSKLIQFTWGNHFSCNYNLELAFHKLTSKHKANNSWFHQDKDSIFAGVIYLSKNPSKNTGTIIKDKKTIANKYNRAVIYNSALTHRVENTFDTRLTLTFFFNKLSFNYANT